MCPRERTALLRKWTGARGQAIAREQHRADVDAQAEAANGDPEKLADLVPQNGWSS